MTCTSLTMRNLTWTEIRTVPQIHQLLSETSVNTISGNQLVFHGRAIVPDQRQFYRNGHATTWILDVNSMSFREYTATSDHPRKYYKGVGGLNSCVMIIGGIHSDFSQHVPSSYCIRLEPKSLQELAMKMIYENHAALPWKQLPMKLRKKIMGASPEEDIEEQLTELPTTPEVVSYLWNC